jgi:hypothetical protein
LLSSLNYKPWKIRGSNTDQHGKVSIAKIKIAKHRETSLITTWEIADMMVVFRCATSGEMAGTGTLGIIQSEIRE